MEISTENNSEKIMQSLQGMERASLSPFFKTRLNAHLQHQSAPNEWSGYKYAFVISLSAVLLIMNSLMIKENKTNTSMENTKEETGLEDFSGLYNFNSSSINYLEYEQQK